MKEIKFSLNDGEYKSISGVQFTDNYLNKAINIYDYALSLGDGVITSLGIQEAMLTMYNHQKSDIRSLLSLLKKLSFTNDFAPDLTGNNYFTTLGSVFVQISKIKKDSITQQPIFRQKIDNAFKYSVQKGLRNAWENKDKTDSVPATFWLLMEILGLLGTISGKEYLYAINCYKTMSIEEIGDNIVQNRRDKCDYVVTNSVTNKLIANTAFSYNFGILLQAGIIKEGSNGNYVLITKLF